MPITILIADDHGLVRKGLRALLEKEPDLEPIAEAANGREAVQLAKELRPDVVLMDMAMPEMSGLEAMVVLSEELPQVRIVALSMHSDRRLVVEALKAGACAYVLKDCAFSELAATVRTVMNGECSSASPPTGIIVSDNRNSEDPAAAFAFLSTRERQVLQLIAEGKNTKEVAFLLQVSVKTAESHRQNIMAKLNIHSVAELTKFAIRQGLTTV